MSPGRRFLRDLLVLAVPVALLLGWAELRLRGRPTLLRLRRERLERMAPAVEVVVLGSSHEMRGIDDTRLSRPAFNLAGASQSIWYSAQILRRYLDRLPRLRHVVLGVSYHSIEGQLVSGQDFGLRVLYYETFRVPPPDGFRLTEALNLSLVHRLGIERARETLRKPVPTPEQLASAESVTPVPQEQFDTRADERVSFHHGRMDPAWIEPNVKEIEDLAAELARRGIRLTLLTCPVSDPYLSHGDPVRLERMKRVMEELAARHGLKWFDYRKDPRFGRTDFVDLDHLNREAGARFTAIVDAEVLP